MELKLKLSMKAKVLVTQSCLTLCNPVDWSLPGDPGILQARTLEQVAIPFSRGSSQTRDWTQVSCTAGRFSTIWATREAQNKVNVCVNINTSYIYMYTHIHMHMPARQPLKGPAGDVRAELQGTSTLWGPGVFCSHGSAHTRELSFCLHIFTRQLSVWT